MHNILSQLVVGDEIIVNMSYDDWQVAKVVHITPTQVHAIVERPAGYMMKFRKSNGKQIGADDWHPTVYMYLRGDEEAEKRLHNTQHSRWRNNTVRHIQADIAEAPDEVLRQVTKIIKQEKETTNG